MTRSMKMSSSNSISSLSGMKAPGSVTIQDGCQVNLSGQMNERQIDREQDIQNRKINLGWGAIITGSIVAIGGIMVAYMKSKE